MRNRALPVRECHGNSMRVFGGSTEGRAEVGAVSLINFEIANLTLDTIKRSWQRTPLVLRRECALFRKPSYSVFRSIIPVNLRCWDCMYSKTKSL